MHAPRQPVPTSSLYWLRGSRRWRQPTTIVRTMAQRPARDSALPVNGRIVVEIRRRSVASLRARSPPASTTAGHRYGTVDGVLAAFAADNRRYELHGTNTAIISSTDWLLYSTSCIESKTSESTVASLCGDRRVTARHDRRTAVWRLFRVHRDLEQGVLLSESRCRWMNEADGQAGRGGRLDPGGMRSGKQRYLNAPGGRHMFRRTSD